MRRRVVALAIALGLGVGLLVSGVAAQDKSPLTREQALADI